MEPTPRHRAVGGAVLVALIGAGIAGGTVALAILVGLVLAFAYLELRRLLHPGGSVSTLVIGLAAVGAGVWLAVGGRPGELSWVLLALVLGLFALRIVAVELEWARIEGTVADVGATVAAAGIVGILGGHVVLIRGSRFGFRGIVAFAAVVAAANVVAALARRGIGRHPIAPAFGPDRTWGEAAAGVAGALVAGAVVGAVWEQPFGLRAGLALGVAVGVLLPIGALAVGAIERSAGVNASAAYLPGPRGVLDVIGGALLGAPMFYWGFRTLVL